VKRKSKAAKCCTFISDSFLSKNHIEKKLQLTLSEKNGLITGANFPQQEE
jgi:hypothetical protein